MVQVPHRVGLQLDRAKAGPLFCVYPTPTLHLFSSSLLAGMFNLLTLYHDIIIYNVDRLKNRAIEL